MLPRETVKDPFSAEEWNAHCHRVTRAMADHASRFSTPISIAMNDGRIGKHLGTGSYHDILGTKVLLTCQHVLTFLDNNQLAHKLQGHDRYISVGGTFGDIGWPIDAAAALIVGWDSIRHQSEALPLARIDMAHRAGANELLFVHGYASENAQFIVDELRTDGTAYLAREAALPGNEDVDARFHFGIEYRRDAAVEAFGGRGLPDPHAMSGSLVWNTRFVECALAGREWTPNEAIVTGLLWSWPDERCIVATRIEYVRSFLLSVFDRWKSASAVGGALSEANSP